GLDARAVGDGVAVREADLHQGGAAVGQFPDDAGRGAEVGVAGGHEGDERLAPLGAQPLEERVNGIHTSHERDGLAPPVSRLRLSETPPAKPQAASFKSPRRGGAPPRSSPCHRGPRSRSRPRPPSPSAPRSASPRRRHGPSPAPAAYPPREPPA